MSTLLLRSFRVTPQILKNHILQGLTVLVNVSVVIELKVLNGLCVTEQFMYRLQHGLQLSVRV